MWGNAGCVQLLIAKQVVLFRDTCNSAKWFEHKVLELKHVQCDDQVSTREVRGNSSVLHCSAPAAGQVESKLTSLMYKYLILL